MGKTHPVEMQDSRCQPPALVYASNNMIKTFKQFHLSDARTLLTQHNSLSDDKQPYKHELNTHYVTRFPQTQLDSLYRCGNTWRRRCYEEKLSGLIC